LKEGGSVWTTADYGVAIVTALVHGPNYTGSSPAAFRSATTNGDGLGFAGHTVEHLDGKGDLAGFSITAASAQLGADQAFIPGYRRFHGVSFVSAGHTLPLHAATPGHELDVPVTRALTIRIGCARHRRSSGWDNHLGRRAGLALRPAGLRSITPPRVAQ